MISSGIQILVVGKETQQKDDVVNMFFISFLFSFPGIKKEILDSELAYLFPATENIVLCIQNYELVAKRAVTLERKM